MKAAQTRTFDTPTRMPMTDDERRILWSDYLVCRDSFMRNSLVVEYMPVVKYIAESINSRLPNSVMVDDLVSYGTFGLLEAIENFDPGRGVKFETFCAPRVRGAILDGLRAQDWVPRITRSRMRKVRRAQDQLENELGRQPTPRELAARLDVDVSQLQDLLSEVSSVTIFSLSDSTGDPSCESALCNIDYIQDAGSNDPLETLTKQEIMNVARTYLEEREFNIIDSYYNDEMTMRDIGDSLGMSESRVSQIHSHAIERLRSYLTRTEKAGHAAVER
jgi:RNA polymerase sigma factor for flagellar operon FliA